MKFRHIILAAAALTCAAATVDAKNIEDYRIYINPGHGGWEGGDRHMGTVKHGPATYLDTCGFFETNTNTWKGLALLHRLAEYGFKFDPTLNPFPADFDGYTNANGIKTNADLAFRYGAARDMSQGLVMSHVKNGYSRDINEIAMESRQTTSTSSSRSTQTPTMKARRPTTPASSSAAKTRPRAYPALATSRARSGPMPSPIPTRSGLTTR